MKYFLMMFIVSFSLLSSAATLNERICDTVINQAFREMHGTCPFQAAWLTKIHHQAEYFSVVTISLEACGILELYETVLENRSCRVLDRQLLNHH